MTGHLWRAFTWYYRISNRLTDRVIKREEERWRRRTEAERQNPRNQRRHLRHLVSGAIFTIFFFTCCVPLVLGEVTLRLVEFPRVEWMLSWIVGFWLYFVFLLWLRPPN